MVTNMAKRHRNTIYIASPGALATIGVAVPVEEAALLAIQFHFYSTTPVRYRSSTMSGFTMCAYAIGFAAALFCFVLAWLGKKKNDELRARIYDLTDEGVPADDFLAGRHVFKADGEITGCYVLHNVTNDKYYVGQSTKVIGRVTQHFTGAGNGDVYADYKYGCKFEVHIIPLVGSGCNSLNELERQAIFTYDAFNKGYNRTRGNRA